MSQLPENRDIALRAQDFHEGLKDVSTFGPKEAHLQATLLVGKAASLVTHLKGLNFVDNAKGQLVYLAAELGITGLELRSVLAELEEVDFASVVGSGLQIRWVELRIPELRDSYVDLGERWKQLQPTEIEGASVQILHSVAALPTRELDVQGRLGISNADFETIVSIASAGALLERYALPEGDILLFSPLTVEEKPEAFLELVRRFPDKQVVATLDAVRQQQGVPANMIKNANPQIVQEAVLLGVFCPVRISTEGKEHTFLFTPRGGLAREERVILERARAIWRASGVASTSPTTVRFSTPRCYCVLFETRRRLSIRAPYARAVRLVGEAADCNDSRGLTPSGLLQSAIARYARESQGSRYCQNPFA